MPSGSSDAYGGAGFAAGVVTICVLEFLTAVFLLAPYLLPVTALPAVIVTALAGWGLTRGSGAVARVGRGMLVGCVSVPLTVVILIPAYLGLKAAGLV